MNSQYFIVSHRFLTLCYFFPVCFLSAAQFEWILLIPPQAHRFCHISTTVFNEPAHLASPFPFSISILWHPFLAKILYFSSGKLIWLLEPFHDPHLKILVKYFQPVIHLSVPADCLFHEVWVSCSWAFIVFWTSCLSC
jgi:hypothetical protein